MAFGKRNTHLKGNTDNEYNLSVKKFAELCDTTRDTLRYYYQTGVLVPKVDPKNGYHLYSKAQSSAFFYISRMREFGYSIEEIKLLLSVSNPDTYREKIEEKEQEIRSQIQKMQHSLDVFHQLSSLLERIEHIEALMAADHVESAAYLSGISPIQIYCTPVEDPKHAYGMKELTGDIRNHIYNLQKNGQIPPLPMGASITAEDLLGGTPRYHDVISLNLGAPLTERPGKDEKGVKILSLPASGIIETIAKSNGTASDAKKAADDAYRSICRAMEEKSLKPASDLFVLSLYNVYGTEDEHSYMKYMFITVR